jgi:diacylglycerol kinase family enzyme
LPFLLSVLSLSLSTPAALLTLSCHPSCSIVLYSTVDLVIYPHQPRCATLGVFDELKKSTHVYNETIEYRRVKSLRITNAANSWINVDGENCARTPVSMEVLPRCIPIFFDHDRYK